MTRIATLSPEQVEFEPFEPQDLEEIGQEGIQSGTPSRLCMIGLVVVYCSGTFFAGLR